MKKWAVIVFGLMIFSSCKKGTDFTSAKIKVLDLTDNRFEPHVKVKLDEARRVYNNGCRICASRIEWTTIKEGYTDSNGFFDFGEFETSKSDDYEYWVGKCDWDKPCGGGLKISKGQLNDLTFNVADPVPLNIKFLPPPPYGIGDSLRVDFFSSYCPYPVCHYFITNGSYTTNNNFDLEFTGSCYFEIKKYKSGVFSDVKDTVNYSNDSAKVYSVIW